MIQRYGFWHSKDWEGQPGEFEPMPDDKLVGNSGYVLFADYEAEVKRLQDVIADAEHLCKWLLQSDISEADRERVIRENGINFSTALGTPASAQKEG